MFKITTRRKGELSGRFAGGYGGQKLVRGLLKSVLRKPGCLFLHLSCCKEHAVSRLAVDRCRQEVHVNRQRKRNMCEKGISLLFRWLSDKKPQRV